MILNIRILINYKSKTVVIVRSRESGDGSQESGKGSQKPEVRSQKKGTKGHKAL